MWSCQANRGEFGDDERKGQKEINLKNDVDVKIRAEVYKNYLMYSMSGVSLQMPTETHHSGKAPELYWYWLWCCFTWTDNPECLFPSR